MKKKRPLYRRNHPLIFVFLGMLTLSLLAGLFAAYKNTERLVDTQFRLNKSMVFEATMQGYTSLIQDSIPAISSNNGYLDSASFGPLARRYFLKFPFIQDIVFYKLEISNRAGAKSIRVQNLRFSVVTVIKYLRSANGNAIALYKRRNAQDAPTSALILRCNEPIYNFVDLINESEPGRIETEKQVARKLFRISALSLSYMNIPQKSELIKYRAMMYDDSRPMSPPTEQDLIFFDLNPARLEVINTQPRLYQKIKVGTSFFTGSEDTTSFISGYSSLPKAFSDYGLYFMSSRKFLENKIIRSYLPNAGIFIIIYTLTLLIAYLIFRNLNINSILFKLQYDFINNFTHEFKTPVSVIKIVGSNLKSGEYLSNSELLHYGNIIDVEADKLDKLMNRLLSFTQLENRSIPLKRERISMNSLCTELITAYGITHPDFIITCEVGQIIYFNTDKILLYSVFTNLADNAYRYSKAGKKELIIVIKKSNHNLYISFTDKGIGISSKEVRHIFNKFYKIENEFNQQGSVGIGLAFCKEIIQFMRGEMIVSSRLGKGTEFTIKLPILE